MQLLWKIHSVFSVLRINGDNEKKAEACKPILQINGSWVAHHFSYTRYVKTMVLI